MWRHGRIVLAAVLGWSFSIASQAQCGFHIEPAAEARWFRAEGWATPGVAEAKWVTKVNLEVDGKPQSWNFPDGITFAIGWFKEKHDVWFPEAVFSVDGAGRHMAATRFSLARLVRWEMDGKVYAYSYELGPYDVACMASVDLIDDQGDGKFRWIVPGGHTLMFARHPEPPPVPEWAKRPKS